MWTPFAAVISKIEVGKTYGKDRKIKKPKQQTDFSEGTSKSNQRKSSGGSNKLVLRDSFVFAQRVSMEIPKRYEKPKDPQREK